MGVTTFVLKGYCRLKLKIACAICFFEPPRRKGRKKHEGINSPCAASPDLCMAVTSSVAKGIILLIGRLFRRKGIFEPLRRKGRKKHEGIKTHLRSVSRPVHGRYFICCERNYPSHWKVVSAERVFEPLRRKGRKKHEGIKTHLRSVSRTCARPLLHLLRKELSFPLEGCFGGREFLNH